MKSVFLILCIILMMSISCRAQKETWKFNTNTCNSPRPSISFNMNFIKNKPMARDSGSILKIYTKGSTMTVIPPLGSIRMNTIITYRLEIQEDSIVTIYIPNEGIINISSIQPTWYELNKNIIKKYYGAKIKGGGRNILIVKSKKKDKEEIKQIICDYWK